ncbi:MAG TPA: 16S rRNA (guanine(527)-N(7))-methyltransferase RsmG [Candidatus Limnocylindrales bacterium]
MGRPRREPIEPGKTAPARSAQHDHAGSVFLRRHPAHPQEGCLIRQRESLPTRVQGLPELPATYRATLDAGLEDLGLTLTDDARAAIDGHVRLLLAWTAAINLTSIRDPAAVARLHVIDSLTAVPVLRSRGIDRLVDLGSGGGFPGLTLAAAVPTERALLIDSVGKKVAFLETAIAATNLGARAAAAAVRAEQLAADPRHRDAWPAVTARAVGSLAELVELAFPLLRPGGCLVAWKRGSIDDELQAARRAMDAVGGGDIDVVEPRVHGLEGHKLVVATKARRTPPGFPRDPAERRRRPW